MELKELIKERLNPEELVDTLGLTTEELVEELWNTIYEQRDRFAYLYSEAEELDVYRDDKVPDGRPDPQGKR
jgi:hypothetical protein